jgi:hypothetical protein
MTYREADRERREESTRDAEAEDAEVAAFARAMHRSPTAPMSSSLKRRIALFMAFVFAGGLSFYARYRSESLGIMYWVRPGDDGHALALSFMVGVGMVMGAFGGAIAVGIWGAWGALRKRPMRPR